MSDLVGGPGSGRASNGGARAQGPVPVSQSGQQSKLTTPTDIMRRRREREEAKMQAEAASAAAAALAQTRPMSNRMSIPPTSRPLERPSTETAGIPEASGHRRSQSSAQSQARISDPVPQESSTRPSPAASGNPGANLASSTRPPVPTGELPSIPRPRPTAQSQGQPRPVPATTNPSSAAALRRPQPQKTPQSSAETPRPRPAVPATATSAQTAASTFPHAFERWETLSSHWEGLTSYWIRKLEQNTKELEREPLLQQLSRQVTDLSAAGANLFHAVVELQRLRASSERKFQRWFHETRKESERQQEVAAQFERALLGERGARSNDVDIMQAELDAAHAAVARLEKQNSEMQREQQISKDEARRAWEELGRREQEAREQVAALREGQPILIGGMQVFPTAHGTSLDRLHHEAPHQQDIYGHTDTRGSPTNTDPFTEHQATPGHASTSHETRPVMSATTGPLNEPVFYQHPTSYLHTGSDPLATPEEAAGGHNTFAEQDDDYEQGEHTLSRYDSHGQSAISQSSRPVQAGHNDYPVVEDNQRERARRAKYEGSNSTAVSYPPIPAPTSGRIEPVSAPASAPLTTYSGPVASQPVTAGSSFAHAAPADYEGAGYDEYDPNQINSRLSVVDEVDEEASRASVVSSQNPHVAPF